MADILTVTTGKVDCRLAVTTNDQNAPNPLFDTIAPSGYVYLRPRKTAFVASDPGVIVIPDEISLVVDAEGWAVMPDSSGGPSDVRTIDLPAAEGMTWQVSFDLRVPAYPWQTGVAENRLRVAPFDIPVEPGTTTHIADYLPAGVDPSTGTVWVKGDKGDRGPGIKDMVQVDGELLVELEDGRTVGPFDLPASDVPGPKGDAGPKGDRGPVGPGGGLPDGGTTNQVPIRASDGGTAWASAASLIPAATTSASGLMSTADKTRLNSALTTVPPAAETVVGGVTLKQVKDLADANVGAQISTALGHSASVDELGQSIYMPGFFVGTAYSDTVTTNSAPSVWVAPYRCQIVSATIVWDYFSQPSDNTNNIGISLRKRAGENITTFAGKGSKEEAIVARQPWTYDSVSWNTGAATFERGDILTFQWSIAGTVAMKFPCVLTLRWIPA